ncbi:hypothetical protein WJX74_005480 [Apatococcus lobatus]|uniref:Mitogen-activated protein kinase organizer 1 n=2 Tax=Apatococcus TaxID=904362 RepID=A0AAW1TC13_9CHLO
MRYGPALPDEPSSHDRLPSERTFELKGHEGPVLAVRFNRSGTYCLSCGKDRTLRLWNPHRGIPIKSYHGHGYDVRDVAVSTDNSKLASGGGDRQIFLWDVATGRTLRKFRGHDGVVNSICYGPDDGVIVSGGYDQAVMVWDTRSRSFDPIQSMKPFGDSVTAVAVSKSAEVIASSVDGTLRRFDARAGCLYTDDLHHPITSMVLSHDDHCVLAGCLDGSLRLLDRVSGELLAQYTGHVAESYRMEVSMTPSDSHVLAGSEDGRICYWDLVEERMVKSFQAHAGVVCSQAIHPESKCLLTSSTDGSIFVWQ